MNRGGTENPQGALGSGSLNSIPKHPLREYLRILLVHKWVALLCFVLVAAGTIYYLRTTDPVYESEVTLIRESSSALQQTVAGLPTLISDSTAGHAELLRSRVTTSKIQEKLSAEHGQHFALQEIAGNISLVVDSNRGPILKIRAHAATSERAQVLADIAAEVYLEIVTTMKKSDLERGVRFLQGQLNLTEQQLRQSEEALNQFKEKEGLFASASTTISRESRPSTALLSKLGRMQEDLARTQMDTEWAQAQLDSVESLIQEKRQTPLDSLTESLPASIDQIQSKLVDLQLQRDTLLEQFTPKDRQVVALQQQIDALQKRLESEMERVLQGNAEGSLDLFSELRGLLQQAVNLKVQIRGLEQKSKLINKRIQTFKQEHPELISKQVELTRLERQSRVYEQSYISLLSRLEELRLLSEMKATGIRVLDSASLPVNPIRPQKTRVAIFGLMLGLMLGIGAAFFSEYLDDSVRLPEDVTACVGLSVIGNIPRIHPLQVPDSVLKSMLGPPVPQQGDALPTDGGLIPVVAKQHRTGKRAKELKRLLCRNILFAAHKSPIVSSYRALAANIQYATLDMPPRMLLVTSSLPAEGKTVTVTNLAISLAQTGKRVLLIDTDLRKPRVHRLFQQERKPGLTDLLTLDQSAFELTVPNEQGFVRATSVDDLWILPAGSHVSVPEALFASNRMKTLLDQLSEEYDMLLFDSPPVLVAADAMVIANRIDGVLLVVRSGSTKRDAALQGYEVLQKVNAPLLGVVLNDIDYSRQYGSYYYYYYYRGYYYQSEEEE